MIRVVRQMPDPVVEQTYTGGADLCIHRALIIVPMNQPTCCKKPSWKAELDLDHAGGFEFILGKCNGCGKYQMNVFCVASGITGYEPVSLSDIERMESIPAGPELKTFMRKWAEENI